MPNHAALSPLIASQLAAVVLALFYSLPNAEAGPLHHHHHQNMQADYIVELKEKDDAIGEEEEVVKEESEPTTKVVPALTFTLGDDLDRDDDPPQEEEKDAQDSHKEEQMMEEQTLVFSQIYHEFQQKLDEIHQEVATVRKGLQEAEIPLLNKSQQYYGIDPNIFVLSLAIFVLIAGGLTVGCFFCSFRKHNRCYATDIKHHNGVGYVSSL